MTPAAPSLDSLGLHFGTDKSSADHGYLPFYERYFAPLRGRHITLLEIGVLGGSSLAVWEAYFPQARIIGADIDPDAARFARPRVAVEIVDQSNLEHLVQLGMKHGPFDVVIDDGSHQWEHQITSLRTLFPFVRNGGLYIVEDLQTNYGALEDGFRGVSSISCMEYLKRLVDYRVADTGVDISLEEDPFLRTYGRAMHSITFFKHACLIEKFVRPDSVANANLPPIAVGAGPKSVPLTLIVHVGGLGDKTCNAGWFRSAEPDQNIQGFTLAVRSGAECALEYRARLADGSWAEWVAAGVYAGTRGLSQDLTGFSVRLAAESRGRFTLAAAGRFTGVAETVKVAEGQACACADPSARLSGMQIVVEGV
jgi:hypothetical protein